MSNNIVLIGSMGAGKTTLGRKLSKTLNRPFVDVDEEIEKRLGVSIQTIFDTEGEAGFRQREEKVLADILLQSQQSIIATGGGCVVTEGCRKVLMQAFLVVHLDISVKQQCERLKYDNKRPILKQGNAKEKLTQLREQRYEIYKSIADITLSSDTLSYLNLVEKIKNYEDSSYLS